MLKRRAVELTLRSFLSCIFPRPSFGLVASPSYANVLNKISTKTMKKEPPDVTILLLFLSRYYGISLVLERAPRKYFIDTTGFTRERLFPSSEFLKENLYCTFIYYITNKILIENPKTSFGKRRKDVKEKGKSDLEENVDHRSSYSSYEKSL